MTATIECCRPRTQGKPLFPFLGFRFPYEPPLRQKGHLFIPRLFLGLETVPLPAAEQLGKF